MSFCLAVFLCPDREYWFVRGGMGLILNRCSNKFTVETTEWEGVWDR